MLAPFFLFAPFFEAVFFGFKGFAAVALVFAAEAFAGCLADFGFGLAFAFAFAFAAVLAFATGLAFGSALEANRGNRCNQNLAIRHSLGK